MGKKIQEKYIVEFNHRYIQVEHRYLVDHKKIINPLLIHT